MPIGLDEPYGINHTDHLESSTVITDQNGNKVEELLYYPFGEILSDSSPTKVRYKFAGHEFDAETELIYMKARYYDPKLARFVSPDPVVPVRVELYNYRDFKMTQFRQLTDPQALNRYSYVVNNPIVFRDPLGLKKISEWGSDALNVLGYGAGIASKAPPTTVVGIAGRAVSGTIVLGTLAYHGIQYARGQESAYKAACESGLKVAEGISMIIGIKAEKTGLFLGDAIKGFGVPKDIVDAIDPNVVCKETPGPNPTNAVSTQNNPTTTQENYTTGVGSTTVGQPHTESTKKPGSTETEYVPSFNYFGLSQGQSGGSWSAISGTSLDNSASSGAGGGAGFISPPAAGYPGN